MAPSKAEQMICMFMMLGSMSPVPMVVATCTPKNRKAMKLKNAAHKTAQCGFNTRVETMAAIEFAASLKPFKKSKNKAMAMVAMIKTSEASIFMNTRE